MSKQFKRVIHFSYLNIFVLPFFTIFTVKNISYEKNYIVRHHALHSRNAIRTEPTNLAGERL